VAAMQALPIDDVLPAARDAWRAHGACVLVAPPGAGKSTRVPPALLEDCADGEVWCLQPRRAAARALARRIAAERGWTLGEEVGWRIRHDTCGSSRTRLWIVTEGVLTRRLQRDPTLEGCAAVILDEFHERSLHADLACAAAALLRRELRADLRLVVMSATIDPDPVAAFCDRAPVVRCELEPHPLALRHRRVDPRTGIGDAVADAVTEALPLGDGSLLAFLPGIGEIRAAQRALAGCGVPVLPLHGGQPVDEQERALVAGEGRRVILATNVAETSLTVPGVDTVVDSGWARVARFDPDRGCDHLGLERIARFNADQRAGRAARLGPGTAIRLWSEHEDRRLAEAPDPAIVREDLAPLALALRPIHGADPRTFPFFAPPDPERLAAAEGTLHLLGATERAYGPLTGLGRLLLDEPLHPRFAKLLLEAEAHGHALAGALLAACCEEGSPLVRDAGPDPAFEDDAARWIHAVSAPAPGGDVHRGARERVRRAAAERLRRMGLDPAALDAAVAPPDRPTAARLALAAYPERLARVEHRRLILADGPAVTLGEAACRPTTPLAVALALHSRAGRGGVRHRCEAAIPLALDEAEAIVGPVAEEERCRFDPRSGRVVATRRRRLGPLTLAARDLPGEPADRAAAATVLAEALAEDAQFARLREDRPALGALLARWAFCHRRDPARFPAFDAERRRGFCRALADGATSRDRVLEKKPEDWLAAVLPADALEECRERAPTHVDLPGGRRRIDYADPARPVVRGRLQDWLGCDAHPTVDRGAWPLTLDLLAPNGRTCQITDDLPAFWRGSYARVRKDLRGRYPKHAWPERPWEAPGGRR